MCVYVCELSWTCYFHISFFSTFTGLSADVPIFEHANISSAATWHSIMHFALTNHLSYAAIAHLLQFLSICFPNNNLLPSSVYRLKKQYCSELPTKQKFCSGCLKEIPNERTECIERQCKESKPEFCWYMKLSFKDHLKQMYEGKSKS